MLLYHDLLKLTCPQGINSAVTARLYSGRSVELHNSSCLNNSFTSFLKSKPKAVSEYLILSGFLQGNPFRLIHSSHCWQRPAPRCNAPGFCFSTHNYFVIIYKLKLIFCITIANKANNNVNI